MEKLADLVFNNFLIHLDLTNHPLDPRISVVWRFLKGEDILEVIFAICLF
jgi:hypothetical protein